MPKLSTWLNQQRPLVLRTAPLPSPLPYQILKYPPTTSPTIVSLSWSCSPLGSRILVLSTTARSLQCNSIKQLFLILNTNLTLTLNPSSGPHRKGLIVWWVHKYLGRLHVPCKHFLFALSNSCSFSFHG